MVVWPNDKKLAIALTFEFDAEMYWYGKEPKSINSFANLTRGQYGPHEGIYRVIDMLDIHDVKATFFIPGWVIEHYPEQVQLIHDKGHEIAYHGYMHEEKRGISREEEEARMEQCEQIIAGVTGKKPVGHRGPGSIIHPFTMELLAQRDYLYSSNMKNANTPYLHEYNGKKVVELPVDEYMDDANYYFFAYSPFTHDNIHTPNFVNDCWRADFDALSQEPGSVFVLKCHPQLIGRAGRIRRFSELVGYMKARGGWIAPAEKIASYVLAQSK